MLNFLAAKPLTSVENHFLIPADTTSAYGSAPRRRESPVEEESTQRVVD
jgi:hypothetical protein